MIPWSGGPRNDPNIAYGSYPAECIGGPLDGDVYWVTRQLKMFSVFTPVSNAEVWYRYDAAGGCWRYLGERPER